MNTPTKPGLLRRFLKLSRWLAFRLLLLGIAVWSTLALYYSNLPTASLRTVAMVAFALGVLLLFLFVRPFWLARLLFLSAFAAVVVWFLLIPPSNQRDWQPDVALLPYAETNGTHVTIHNIRNCDYRTETDYTARYYDKTVDLARLRSVDLYLIYWGSPMIAHTMLSFGFDDGTYVCFSIETRKQKGQEYSAIKGLFRQFELTYIIGDERDLVRLRTNFRHEQVYLYRLNTDLAIARLVFLDYLKEINSLKDHPEWYNAVTSNCTTNIRGHTSPYVRKSRWNWRLLINGYVDELAYAVGTLNQSLPFRELKERSLINTRAQAADNDPAFSTRIRENLPGVGDQK